MSFEGAHKTRRSVAFMVAPATHIAMSFCSKCGARADPTGAFCSACGAALTLPAPADIAPLPAMPPAQLLSTSAPPSLPKRGSAFKVFVSAIVAFVLLAACIAALGDQDETSTAAMAEYASEVGDELTVLTSSSEAVQLALESHVDGYSSKSSVVTTVEREIRSLDGVQSRLRAMSPPPELAHAHDYISISAGYQLNSYRNLVRCMETDISAYCDEATDDATLAADYMNRAHREIRQYT